MAETLSCTRRSGQEVTERYPELVVALRALPLERFLIDGEIVALDENGRSSFQRLQARMGLTRPADIDRARALVPVSAVFFDALALDGHDLRDVPLVERKAALALMLPPRGVLSFGQHVAEHGEAFYEAASEQHLEGIVAKKADSRYEGRRSRDWLKIKCQKRQEFVIGGYTDPQGSRGYFGALHLGRLRRRPPRLRLQGRDGLRREDSQEAVGGARAARPRDVALRRRHAERTRPSLGRAPAGRRSAVHGVDRRRWPSASSVSWPSG